MNQTIAIPLALLCILVTWAYVWSHIVVRRTQKGEHAVIAHIFAAIYGTGAAFGTFLLVGATLISPRHELDVTMASRVPPSFLRTPWCWPNRAKANQPRLASTH